MLELLSFLGKSATEYVELLENSNPCDEVNEVARYSFDNGSFL